MKKIIVLLTVFATHINFCKEKKYETVVITGNTHINEDDLLYAPISDFLNSPEKGIQCFFKHKYNNPKYATEVLPYSLRDLIDFLKFCKKTNLNRTFVKDILRIFKQKLSSTEFICATELASTISQIPDLVENLIIETEKLNNKKSKDVDISAKELRSAIFGFAEASLAKVLWSCNTEANTWQEFKDLGASIYKLYTNKIAKDESEINDLIVEMLASFTKSLKLRAADLSYDFFEKAKENLANKADLEWLFLDEADELITPKAKILMNTILICEVKARAKKEYGILPDKF